MNKGRGLNSFEIYGLAIGANLAYSSASLIYSLYAKRFSSIWINQIKVLTAFVAFSMAMLIGQRFVSLSHPSLGFLLLSGFSGLCLGDIFIFRAFRTLGASRSLIIYSFQPLLLSIYGYIFLKQILRPQDLLAFLSMVTCVFIFMLERNKNTGSWDIKSFLWAFLGICLDAIGIILTRTAYDAQPELETFQVNTVRCLGAIAGFILLSPRGYFHVFKDLKNLKYREQSLVITSSFIGCFLSLTMYLAALKHAHVGMLTSIAITGPVWVSLLECIYERKAPSRFLLGAFSFFIFGFYLMVS